MFRLQYFLFFVSAVDAVSRNVISLAQKNEKSEAIKIDHFSTEKVAAIKS